MHSFLPFDRCYMILPCYLHSIYIVCIKYRLWRWHFGSQFEQARPRIQIWRKNLQVWRKIFLKVVLRGVHEVRVFQVWTRPIWNLFDSESVSTECSKTLWFSSFASLTYVWIRVLKKNLLLKSPIKLFGTLSLTKTKRLCSLSFECTILK